MNFPNNETSCSLCNSLMSKAFEFMVCTQCDHIRTVVPKKRPRKKKEVTETDD